MQLIAHLKVNNEVIPVLVRCTKTHRYFKVRKSIAPIGQLFDEESRYLESSPLVLQLLRDGKTIKL